MQAMPEAFVVTENVPLGPEMLKVAPAKAALPFVVVFEIEIAPSCSVLVYVHSIVSSALSTILTVAPDIEALEPFVVTLAEQSRLVKAKVGLGSVSDTL